MMRNGLIACTAIALATGACYAPQGDANAAPAKTPRSISASEKAQGAKYHPDLLAEYGGPYTGPQADYVTRVGKKISVQSGLSNAEGDFTITLLNSPVNNAFAIPGGYVYITRQLLALMNDEAELASVMGHEVGHVAARHSAKRNTTSTIGQILSAGVGILTGNSTLGQLAGYGTQLYTLGYSRKQEYQADDLGVAYLARGGYDPLAASDMLAALGAQTALDGKVTGQTRDIPTWTSTHPNSADRVIRARKQATTTGIPSGQGLRNRDAFISMLDGMLYDDDPKEGLVVGQQFIHPVLKLKFTAPTGYNIINGSDAVTISGTGGKAQFSAGKMPANGLAGHIDAVFKAVGGNTPIQYGEITNSKINGINAAQASARANTSSGQVDVVVTAFDFGQAAYHFLTIAPAGQGVGPLGPLVNSLSRITDAEAAAIKPREVDVVTVKAGDTPATLSGRMAYADYKLERLLTLNALDTNAKLIPGQKLKLIVYRK